MVAFTVLSGRWREVGGGRELVVSGRLQEEGAALQVGAAVTLVIRGQPSQWTVVGVIPAVLASAFVARDAWASVVGSSSVTRVVVAALDTNLVAQGELRRLAQQELAGHGFEVSSGLLAENRASVEDHLLMVAEFLSVMGWLMIVVGGLGLASTMSLAVLERTREIGCARSARGMALST